MKYTLKYKPDKLLRKRYTHNDMRIGGLCHNFSKSHFFKTKNITITVHGTEKLQEHVNGECRFVDGSCYFVSKPMY
jgi:hypothetical protein